MPQALVTGAHGFIGRHVALHLAQSGYAVTGLGHGAWLQSDQRRWGISDWHEGDVTPDSLLRCAGEPELVVHCAGSGSVGFSVDHPFQDFLRTVAASAALFDHARAHMPGTRLVIPSSAAVYGAVGRLPIAESAPLDPVSPYGTHKMVTEHMARSYARQYGVRIAIVRLFSVYGPGLRKQLLWDACGKLMRGDRLFYGTGMETRDWLHVSDAAALLAEAGRRASPSCPTINGGTGIASTVRDTLTTLAGKLGIREPVAFSGLSRAGDPTAYQADTDLLSSWSWQPGIALEQGLNEYADWFRAGAP